MDEENLTTNIGHSVVRIDSTVHRQAHWWTPAVHELLSYLESAGFKYSPRVLGFDERGREVLSYIEGDSGKDGWSKVISEAGLKNFAKLLREYHEAVKDFRPSPALEWAYAKGAPKPGQIMCHGDFGPWNVVWRGEKPVGIVDWDFALPAAPEYDVLYALEYTAPFRDDQASVKDHHFPEIPNRKQRVEIFLEAYGSGPIKNIAKKVAAMQRQVGKYEAALAARGLQPQADWVAGGDLERIEKLATWSESHAELFE